MKLRWARTTGWPALALTLAIAPLGAQAQGADAAVQDWRQANEAVGQFPRGHADVLRWESTQPPLAGTGQQTAPAFALATAADAVRAEYVGGQSIKRLVDPHEIADLCVYLASDKARMISGQAIAVDGHSETFHM